MDDLISRKDAIDALTTEYMAVGILGEQWAISKCIDAIKKLPSVQSEPLTDKEQRIFLAAMKREEKVCKEVDEECRDCREPYEDSLVKTCHEITRKVKDALWVI